MILLLYLLSAGRSEHSDIVRGEVIYTDPLNSIESIENPKGFVEIVTYEGRDALKVSWTEEEGKESTHMVRLKFKDIPFAGKGVKFTCSLACENVSEPLFSWNGVKFMFVYTLNGVTQYPAQSQIRDGTHNWTQVEFTVKSGSPDDVIEVTGLDFGLQDATGTVYFSDLTIEVYEFPTPSWTIDDDFKFYGVVVTVVAKPPLKLYPSVQGFSFASQNLSESGDVSVDIVDFHFVSEFEPIPECTNDPELCLMHTDNIEDLEYGEADGEGSDADFRYAKEAFGNNAAKYLFKDFVVKFVCEDAEYHVHDTDDVITVDRIANDEKESKSGFKTEDFKFGDDFVEFGDIKIGPIVRVILSVL